jgi:hypothetical protein
MEGFMLVHDGEKATKKQQRTIVLYMPGPDANW